MCHLRSAISSLCYFFQLLALSGCYNNSKSFFLFSQSRRLGIRVQQGWSRSLKCLITPSYWPCHITWRGFAECNIAIGGVKTGAASQCIRREEAKARLNPFACTTMHDRNDPPIIGKKLVSAVGNMCFNILHPAADSEGGIVRPPLASGRLRKVHRLCHHHILWTKCNLCSRFKFSG